MHNLSIVECLICGRLSALGYCDVCLCSIDVMYDSGCNTQKWLNLRRVKVIIELLCLIHNWQGWHVNAKIKYGAPCKRKLMLFP